MAPPTVACLFGIFCLSVVDYASYEDYKLGIQRDGLLHRNEINMHMLSHIDAYKTYQLRKKVEFELAASVYEEASNTMYAVEKTVYEAKQKHKTAEHCLQLVQRKVDSISANHVNSMSRCLQQLHAVHKSLSEDIEKSNQTSKQLKEQIQAFMQNCASEQNPVACRQGRVRSLTESLDKVEDNVNRHSMAAHNALTMAKTAIQCIKREQSKLKDALKPAENDGKICAQNAQ